MKKRALKKFMKSRYRSLGHVARVITWILPVFSKLLFSSEKNKSSILLIYDFETQPFSIGDFLLFQELATIIKALQKFSSINLAIVFDENNPTPSDKAFKSINTDNFRYNLISLLPIALISNDIDEFHIFNSKQKFEHYLSGISNEIETFPSGWKLNLTREYLYYTIFDEIIYPCYLSEGSIPELRLSNFLNNWANCFFQKNAPNKVSITVNLRLNNIFQKNRNSDFSCWLDFFKYAKQFYKKTHFFIICSESEIDSRFRELANVTLVKDFHTRIDEELALIKNSAIHLGASSGPALAAWFGSKPYLIMNTTLQEQIFANEKLVIKDGPDILRFVFANSLQRFIVGPEKLEILVSLFDECLQSNSVSQWSASNLQLKNIDSNSSWLR